MSCPCYRASAGLGACMRPIWRQSKVRGCWSLRSLPFLRYRHGLMHGGLGEYDYQPKVHCDCEKEWWDQLEWKGHDHRSCYEPTHPRHYKKTLLRGSVLI